MSELTTYENDRDWTQLYNVATTDDMILDFIFRKGGRVNATNMNALMSRKDGLGNDVAQHLLSLQQKGLIKPDDSHHYKLTNRAKWIRLYSNPVWQFWAAIATIVALLLSLIAICKNSQ